MLVREPFTLEIQMTDWADGIETRNFGIKREIDGNIFSELMRTIIPLVMIAGALLFYSWIRSQIVHIGYESQSLVAKEEALLRTEEKLRLEEGTLSDPERIDLIARIDLGMTPLRPNQFILPQIQEAGRSLSNAMAMAESEASGLTMVAAKASDFIPAN
jgi:cell division protein FtsL